MSIPEDHPESYHSFMWNNFFKHIDIDPKNVHILNGNAENLENECARFEKEIERVGGVELFLGGIGTGLLYNYFLHYLKMDIWPSMNLVQVW